MAELDEDDEIEIPGVGSCPKPSIVTAERRRRRKRAGRVNRKAQSSSASKPKQTVPQTVSPAASDAKQTTA